MDLPEITEVQRLEIRPGDRLILHTAAYHEIDMQQAQEIKEKVRATLALPADFPVMVMAGDWDVKVVGDEAGG